MLHNKFKKIIKIFGYFFYGITLFFVLVYLKFPYEIIEENISKKIQHSTGKYISINGISPIFPIGFNIKKLLIKDNFDNKKVTIFSAKEIITTLDIKSLLLPEKAIDYSMDAYGGNINGSITYKKNKISIFTDFKDIKTEKYPFNELKLMVHPLSTTLSGSIDVELLLRQKKISEGNFSLIVDSGVIDKLKILNFELPAINYRRITSNIDFKEKYLTIKEFNLESKEIIINVNGNVTLQKKLPFSNVNLTIKFKVSPDYMKKTGIPFAMLNGKKDLNGFLTLKIMGVIGKPRIRF